MRVGFFLALALGQAAAQDIVDRETAMRREAELVPRIESLRQLGRETEELARKVNQLGVLRFQCRQLAEAGRLLTESVGIWEQIALPGNRERIAAARTSPGCWNGNLRAKFNGLDQVGSFVLGLRFKNLVIS